MRKIENIFGQSKIDSEQFYKTGEITCPCCEGSGINPDFKTVNLFQKAVDELCKIQNNSHSQIFKSANTEVPHCLTCYGMKKIDWIQYANGNYQQELIDRKEVMQVDFLYKVLPFLRYIHYGEVWCNDYTSRNYFHFDFENKSWKKAGGFNKDSKSLWNAYIWLNRLLNYGYFNMDNVDDVGINYTELYYDEPEEEVKQIKFDLVTAENLSISKLIAIKHELDHFWYDIQDLNNVQIEDETIENLSKGFNFTWKNILKKFGLPQTYLKLLNFL
jgi:hypothetical protein